jgi:hypothetical protein
MDGPEEQQLSEVGGATRLPDGRLVIVDGGSRQVRVYGPDGSFLARHGREGDGPGEFRSPRLAGRLGDTLVIYDGDQRRVTLLHPDGGFERSFSVGSEGGGYPVARGMFADGTVNFGGGMRFSSDEGFPSGLIRPPSSFRAIRADGREGPVYGEFPGGEMFARASAQSFSAVGIPFGRSTTGVSGHSTFWVGTADRFEILAFGSDGSPSRVVRIDRPVLPVTAELRDAWIAERTEDAADAEARRAVLQRYQDVPSAPSVPAYGAMVVDALDHLWVADYELPGDEQTGWTVLDADGHLIGRVVLPARARVLEAGVDYLLLLRTDELDVERVEVWELIRPG